MIKFPPVPNPYSYSKLTAARNHVVVVCVNVGPKYPPAHVERLRLAVAQNLSIDHDFYCITDNPTAYSIPIITILPELRLDGWWNKFNLFAPGILPEGERVLYLDLDVVITAALDPLVTAAEEFIMIENYSPNKTHSAYNSSCMAWTAGGIATTTIAQGFNPTYHPAATHGDQEVIWKLMDGHITAWPVLWLPSYKYHQRGRGAPTSAAKVVVFHGEPKPEDVKDAWVVAALKMCPTTQNS